MITVFLLGVVCGGLLAVALAVLDEALRRNARRRREKARLTFLDGETLDHWYSRQ